MRSRDWSSDVCSSDLEMAENIKISRSWLGRLLDVVRLPEAIFDAFADRHDITVRVARDIKPLCGEDRPMMLMVKEAAAIVAERDDLGIRLTGPEVAKRLIRATVSQRQKAGGEIEVKDRKSTRLNSSH